MSDEWPEPAVDYVQAIADTKLLLSQRYAEWMLRGPALEEDIAGASAAQDEIGQVRQLFRLLEGQGRDRLWLERDRDAEEYANAASLDESADSWVSFVVQVALTDRATWLLLDAIDHEAFEGLVRKMGQDEYFHLEYHDAELTTLVEDRSAEVQAALETYLPGVLALLGPESYDEAIDPVYRSGFTDRSAAELRAALVDHFADLFEGTEVDVPTPRGPALDDWNERRRRAGDGEIDEETAIQLQGVRNREYIVE